MQITLAFVVCVFGVTLSGCDKVFNRPAITADAFVSKVLQASPNSVGALRYRYSGSVGGYAAVARFTIEDATWINRRFAGAEMAEFDVLSENGQLQVAYLESKIQNALGRNAAAKEPWMELPKRGFVTLRKLRRGSEEILLVSPSNDGSHLLIAVGI